MYFRSFRILSSPKVVRPIPILGDSLNAMSASLIRYSGSLCCVASFCSFPPVVIAIIFAPFLFADLNISSVSWVFPL